MSTATAPAGSAPRRTLRYPAAVSLDVTALRYGVPHKIPGRSLDLCESGLCGVLAGELRPGETVGVEFQLPHGDLVVRAKAVVRHQDRLRCGLEFVGMNVEHEEILRHWALCMRETKTGWHGNPATASPPRGALAAPQRPENAARPRRRKWLPRAAGAVAVLIVAGILGWWRWQQAWAQLETQVPQPRAAEAQPTAFVPANVMDGLVIHKVEPVYPEEARQQNARGLVLLRATVGRDGTVVGLHPVSGPEVLVGAAMDAVRWWRYQPYRVDDRPQVVETTIAVDFAGD